MRRSAGRLEERRAGHTATSERSTSGRNRERDDRYRETSRRDDREKPTSTPPSSGRRTGSSRTDEKPIPNAQDQKKYQEWVAREARHDAEGEKGLIDSCADKIMREQERRKLNGRPLWNWTGQEKKDWCKKESAGDPNRERKLLERYA
ncbi:f3bd647d-eb60-4998-ae75-1fdb149955d1 [Sclerotinia trifoliorum]|uniref:F3bd647d-eb60-4998-ae75-1fdb149955d1 n=1 Tax=Sclerotinia trifoliorum TaxID=28548 RepID=A0A8H2ZSY7_9HELO|nr:f3bd647d-eb60-4998-ae75-1fdb149955d1 [Sclerotinia trifoliorum]